MNKRPAPEQYRSLISSTIISKYQDLIPEMEKGIYDLYCIRDFKQVEIAKIYGLTQGAISHRLNRLMKRVLFLSTLEKYCDNDIGKMFEDLSKILKPLDFEIMKIIFTTTNQNHSAETLNDMFNLTGDRKLNQVKIRYRYNRILDSLKGSKFFKIFQHIRDNAYIMHEVRLPQFDRNKKWKS